VLVKIRLRDSQETMGKKRIGSTPRRIARKKLGLELRKKEWLSCERGGKVKLENHIRKTGGLGECWRLIGLYLGIKEEEE